jgi:hypothetical protein
VRKDFSGVSLFLGELQEIENKDTKAATTKQNFFIVHEFSLNMTKLGKISLTQKPLITKDKMSL